MVTRRNVLATGAAFAASAPFIAAAQTAEFTFTVHHFLSPRSPTHTQLVEPWAERVNAASGGRIQFELFPSMSLGGRPPELFNQVRSGASDIVWTLPGYTANLFPRLEVFELPTVHGGSAEITTKAIQDVMPMLAPDLEEVEPLLIHTHSGNALHTVEKVVAGPDDVRGMKVRTPSRTGAWMLESWSAEPVGMPVPELPQALSRGTVEGALVPFEVAIPLNLAQVTAHSFELAGQRRFGTSTFMLAMNKERFASMPADLQEIVRANSGAAIAGEIGAAWDSIEPIGKDRAREAGNSVVELSEEATAAFDALHAPLSERWMASASEAGVDAEALLEAAQAAMAAHSG